MKPGIREWLTLWKLKGSSRQLPLWMLFTVPEEAFGGQIDPEEFKVVNGAHWPHWAYRYRSHLDCAAFWSAVSPKTNLAIARISEDAYTVWWDTSVPFPDSVLIVGYVSLDEARRFLDNSFGKRMREKRLQEVCKEAVEEFEKDELHKNFIIGKWT